MKHLPLNLREQIQNDNEVHAGNVLIYENGNNYCTFNKSAMQMACCFQDHLFLIESLGDNLIKITFTQDAFECIKRKYNVVSLPPGCKDKLIRWKVLTKHFVSDYNYRIWSSILSLELGAFPKEEVILFELNKEENIPG